MAEGTQVTARDLGLGEHAAGDSPLNLREVRQAAETRAIRDAMVRTAGNVSRAAELLGITRPTLYDLINKYGIVLEGPQRTNGEAHAD
jgi:two-component system NtrC family response regulator